ncbi:hypothetical protein D5086_023408 [Populus alba]|uniref:Uncharacterized protein n=1 Tax=Populus alba TaxID=43335 RepID=A0ACC4B9Q5_POPAL
MEELDGEKWRSCCGWWRQLMSLMVATDQHLRRAGKNRWLDLPVRVLAVIDGHSSADGGRYGLWVWLSVVKKDKRFLKGEGYASTVARRRKVQRLCWLCQWAERCGHQFWKRGDEK